MIKKIKKLLTSNETSDIMNELLTIAQNKFFELVNELLKFKKEH